MPKYDYLDKLFKSLNIVVEVEFKLLIDNVELVDKQYKLLNIIVDVEFLFDNCVVWPFINPNNDVDVEFNFW